MCICLRGLIIVVIAHQWGAKNFSVGWCTYNCIMSYECDTTQLIACSCQPIWLGIWNDDDFLNDFLLLCMLSSVFIYWKTAITKIFFRPFSDIFTIWPRWRCLSHAWWYEAESWFVLLIPFLFCMNVHLVLCWLCMIIQFLFPDLLKGSKLHISGWSKLMTYKLLLN